MLNISNFNRVIAIALGLGLSSVSLFASAESNEHRLVSLQAEVVREVANDEMQASLYTELNDKDATSLANKINRIINTALQRAKSYDQVKIKTGNQNTYPVYDDKQRLQHWRGRAEVVITSRDFKQASQLIAQLQEDLRLGNISFSVSEQQRKAVENELMIDASKSFQQRVQLLLTPWNATRYELVNLQINTSNSSNYRMPMAVMMGGAPSAENKIQSQSYEGGESEVRVTVNGTVQLQ